jgi:hypothetical protein
LRRKKPSRPLYHLSNGQRGPDGRRACPDCKCCVGFAKRKFEAEAAKTLLRILETLQKSNLAIGFRLAEFGDPGKLNAIR